MKIEIRCAKNTVPITEVKINMVTFLTILCILAVIAIVIGILLALAMLIGGAVGGVLIFLFGDIIIGIALVVLIIKAIRRRKRR